MAVDTPEMLTLSKSVCPFTSKSPVISTPLENVPDVAGTAPVNVVAVTTPAMFTLSNSACPFTETPVFCIFNLVVPPVNTLN